jgi:hypothetical protein
MKRETIIASVLGVTLGLVVAGFIVFKTADKPDKKNVIANVESNITPTVKIQQEESYLFDVSAPEDDIVVHSNSVTVSGQASKGSLVVVQSPTDSQILQINEDQSFETNLSLSLGENVIMLSYYPEGSTILNQEKELRVYYFKK